MLIPVICWKMKKTQTTISARITLASDREHTRPGPARPQAPSQLPATGSGRCAAANGRSRAPARRGGAVQDLIQPFRHSSGLLNRMNFLGNIMSFRLKPLIRICYSLRPGGPPHPHSVTGDSEGLRVRPHSWRPEKPGHEPGNVGMRARPGCGAPGAPSSPETGADGLPFRVRPPRRPGSSDVAARDRVVLSDHDLAVIAKAVARARQDGKNAAEG